MRMYFTLIMAIIGFIGLCLPALAANQPARVVTVGAPATEIVFALGAGATVVATDTTSTWPDAVGNLPKVGYMRTLASEGIISLKPDLIVAVENAGPVAVLEDLRALGISVMVLPSLDQLENLPDAISRTATALGRIDEGAELIAKVMADIASIQHLAGANHAKIAFLMAVGHGQPLSAGRNTTADEIIGLVGGENAMAGYDGFKPVSPEIIAADTSDYVLVPQSTLDQFGGIDGIMHHPSLGLHKAVQAGHVVTVSASTILGFGPRSATEIRELAAKLQTVAASNPNPNLNLNPSTSSVSNP
ncbi:heme/hemin ABC transporter substrate-binding protein [Thalassospira alkalitolerans]|uniref:heme/hemin ABC transporter substrate-binding protein n=1 Tax=Thalassospira alkalitolerans TaxID=1293890 RepID=UPI003AA8E7E8